MVHNAIIGNGVEVELFDVEVVQFVQLLSSLEYGYCPNIEQMNIVVNVNFILGSFRKLNFSYWLLKYKIIITKLVM